MKSFLSEFFKQIKTDTKGGMSGFQMGSQNNVAHWPPLTRY